MDCEFLVTSSAVEILMYSVDLTQPGELELSFAIHCSVHIRKLPFSRI